MNNKGTFDERSHLQRRVFVGRVYCLEGGGGCVAVGKIVNDSLFGGPGTAREEKKGIIG